MCITSTLCLNKLTFQYGSLKKILFFFHTTSSFAAYHFFCVVFCLFFLRPASSSSNTFPSNCFRISTPFGTSGGPFSSCVPSNAFLFFLYGRFIGNHCLCTIKHHLWSCFNHVDLFEYIQMGHVFSPLVGQPNKFA
jgi:hypothetical protein